MRIVILCAVAMLSTGCAMNIEGYGISVRYIIGDTQQGCIDDEGVDCQWGEVTAEVASIIGGVLEATDEPNETEEEEAE